MPYYINANINPYPNHQNIGIPPETEHPETDDERASRRVNDSPTVPSQTEHQRKRTRCFITSAVVVVVVVGAVIFGLVFGLEHRGTVLNDVNKFSYFYYNFII